MHWQCSYVHGAGSINELVWLRTCAMQTQGGARVPLYYKLQT